METTQSEQAKLVRKKDIKLKNLEEKLEGKLPITRNELIYLVNSHGRNRDFYLRDENQKEIIIKQKASFIVILLRMARNLLNCFNNSLSIKISYP